MSLRTRLVNKRLEVSARWPRPSPKAPPWSSLAGGAWQLVELPAEPVEGDEAESIQDVAVVDGELLLLGWVDADAAVWRAPLPD
ncbi:MAG: hypothetical protein H0X58_02800 [Acidimicrobiia bacterium]|nr:hypothetical protein [Acidimicrobiia bacterium]